MSLTVKNPGFLTLLQDYGRYGYQHIGVTTGGPLDEHAYLWANYLLGNNYNAPQLEISYGGFSATFTKSTMVALCGADLSATINDVDVSPWESFSVNAGDVISFKTPVSGLRCYLAIQGGFKVEEQLSSCSTVVREKIGGLNRDGEKIQQGDRIDYEESAKAVNKKVPERFVPSYTSHVELRFIPNHSVTSAGTEAYRSLTHKAYEVSQSIDRMGYRLSGDKINTELAGIISQGISIGSIQIPKDGQPIVLMRDRQTMGGYPLIGCVTHLDTCLLAQSQPGTKVSFVPVDVSEAEAELMRHKNFFNIAI